MLKFDLPIKTGLMHGFKLLTQAISLCRELKVKFNGCSYSDLKQ